MPSQEERDQIIEFCEFCQHPEPYHTDGPTGACRADGTDSLRCKCLSFQRGKMSEETKTIEERATEGFVNKPTNRGFERIEFKDYYGVDCSIQASSLATEECIWFGCSKLELKGFRPGSGWKDLDADSLGFKYLQGNTRMHLTREQVGEIIPFLETFYLDGKIEYRDEDVGEIKEVVGNALSAAQEIVNLTAALTAERERREADEIEWTSVSERLPDADVGVLARFRYRNNCCGEVTAIMAHRQGVWFFSDSTGDLKGYILKGDEVIAWMPLPLWGGMTDAAKES